MLFSFPRRSQGWILYLKSVCGLRKETNRSRIPLKIPPNHNSKLGLLMYSIAGYVDYHNFFIWVEILRQILIVYHSWHAFGLLVFIRSSTDCFISYGFWWKIQLKDHSIRFSLALYCHSCPILSSRFHRKRELSIRCRSENCISLAVSWL